MNRILLILSLAVGVAGAQQPGILRAKPLVSGGIDNEPVCTAEAGRFLNRTDSTLPLVILDMTRCPAGGPDVLVAELRRGSPTPDVQAALRLATGVIIDQRIADGLLSMVTNRAFDVPTRQFALECLSAQLAPGSLRTFVVGTVPYTGMRGDAPLDTVMYREITAFGTTPLTDRIEGQASITAVDRLHMLATIQSLSDDSSQPEDLRIVARSLLGLSIR